MKEINLRLERKMIEIDETETITKGLRYYNEERVNQEINIMTYYLDDNVNLWTENPLFTIVTFNEDYEIVKHDSDIEVFNDIYNVLTENGLIERTI